MYLYYSKSRQVYDKQNTRILTSEEPLKEFGLQEIFLFSKFKNAAIRNKYILNIAQFPVGALTRLYCTISDKWWKYLTVCKGKHRNQALGKLLRWSGV